MNDIFYVYIYCNKKFLYKVKNDYGIKYLPIYVGKGKGDRINSHNKKSHNRVLRKYIEKMKRENNDPLIIKIKTGMGEKEAYKLENEIIKDIGVIYAGNGCLFNKLIDGYIYEIYDRDMIREYVEKYEDIVTSDTMERIVVDPSFICYNPNSGIAHISTEKQNKITLLANPIGIPEVIKSRIMEYIKIGFTIEQCSNMTKIPYKQIFKELGDDFIDKWTI